MSKIDQIQSRLLQLDQASFQKLADTYLYKRGYERINPIGSVIGASKTKKGTPDSLVSLANGKYVFAEYTTQQKAVYKKLKSDLNKCFDETKTGVTRTRIEEIVICHTSILTAGEEESLAEECRKRGINLNIFGIGPISNDLYQKYPGLARDFLSVEVDTGQIVSLEDFVVNSSKSKFGTGLGTVFHFRESEVEKALHSLDNGGLTILSGRPGVGKSRLAVEVCEKFKEAHTEYHVKAVFNRGVDVFEDLRVHFSAPGHFLILVDDANRISQFDYFLQLLFDQREDQKIKILVTVRDYAIDRLRKAAEGVGNATEIELQPFEEKEIKELVKKEYGILNPLYLDRIANIAQGNPRLAVMAAKIASTKNSLASINDVSHLYDEYFVSVRKDLRELGDENLLKAAGIAVFFRSIDRSNKEMMNSVAKTFGIPVDDLWQGMKRLHDMEMLDMYEDEVVRIADQVMATYLCYLAFFKEKVISFGILLDNFFPRLRDRFIDAINPVLDVFDANSILAIIKPDVDRIWQAATKAKNDGYIFKLIETFWFIKETDSLLYLKQKIQEISPEPVDISSLEFKSNSDVSQVPLLGALSLFRYSDDDKCRIAIGLLCDYVGKVQKETPRVLYQLTERFGFTHRSYVHDFAVERAVIDVLWDRTEEGKEEFFSKLFIAVARVFIHTHFHTSVGDKHKFTMINFDLTPTPELLSLRKEMWQRLFHLYSVCGSVQPDVLDVLKHYSGSRLEVSVSKIVEQDALAIVPFIGSKLDPKILGHCLIVQEYLDLLQARGVPFDAVLRDRFTGETFVLFDLLTLDFGDMRTMDMSFDGYEIYKQEQIKQHFERYTLPDFEQFLYRAEEIRDTIKGESPKEFQFQNGVTNVFHSLAERDSELYQKVLEGYLDSEDRLEVRPDLIVKDMIEKLGPDRSFLILSGRDYPRKRQWLFFYYVWLPEEAIKTENVDALYGLYEEAEPRDFPYGLDFLLKYSNLDNRVIPKVTAIIVKRAKAEPSYAHALYMLFNPLSEVNKAIKGLFINDCDELKRAYLALTAINSSHPDYDGHTFNVILDLDSRFIVEYIDSMYDKKEYVSRHDDWRDYSFIWRRDDYKQVMTHAIERIYKHVKREKVRSGGYLEVFFAQKGDKGDPDIIEKQDRFLSRLIEERCGQPDFMEYIFSVIAYFPPERRSRFVALFLKHNKDFDAFDNLPLEPDIYSYSGSAVPEYQKQVNFFESLLPFMNTVDLLRHRQKIERQIEGRRALIEQEKKRDFMKD